MRLSYVEVICLLNGLSITIVQSRRHLYSSIDSGDINAGFISRNVVAREKRAVSLAVRGLSALRKLVLGTVKVDLDSQTIRRYEKVGDFEAALKDFYSVNPQNVKSGKHYRYRIKAESFSGTVITGNAGNRRLILKKNGVGGRPTLEVVETKFEPGPYIDQIVYKNKIE